MAYQSYKHRIDAGMADKTNVSPSIDEGIPSVEILPGSAVIVLDGVVTPATGNNVDYHGAVADIFPSTRGGDIETPNPVGDTMKVIQPESKRLVNLLFEAGQNIVKGRSASASTTTAGLHEVNGSGRKLYKVEETLGVLAEDTLVLCKFI